MVVTVAPAIPGVRRRGSRASLTLDSPMVRSHANGRRRALPYDAPASR
jgi:hypothetical protein